jgi:hypothetical protein
VQRVMRLVGEAFAERANHLHWPLPRRDVHLRRSRAKWGGNELSGDSD